MIFNEKEKAPVFSTIIGKGCQITGHLNSADSIRVDGSIKGDIFSDKHIQISEGACVEGNVKAAHILNAGNITGNLTATEYIELEKNAIVTGDIRTESLKISLGAKINGNMSMNSLKESANTVTSEEQIK